jgi:DNA (cytosine-5)-methyltransferase 1
MRFGSLFAGIGGIDLGLERAGMACAWQVENDDYCVRVLEKHWPDVKRYGDVRDVGKESLESVDLIAGGFPCQPHSVAGKRKGAADDRNLWPEFSRIIAELRPRYVLAENVPGIITTYLDTVLSDLEGQGYTCGTFDIPAIAFDAPHKRARIFVVAHRGRVGREAGANQKAIQSEGGKPDSKNANHVRKGLSEGGDVAHAASQRSQGQGQHARRVHQEENKDRQANRIVSGSEAGESHWHAEPDVGRVAHGVPSRVHRLRGLGNAVVPQVAEWIGRRIVEYESLHKRLYRV